MSSLAGNKHQEYVPTLRAPTRRSNNDVLYRSAECPLMAQSGHPEGFNQCPLLEVKRTSRFSYRMSAFDPKRTLGRAGRLRILAACGGNSCGAGNMSED